MYNPITTGELIGAFGRKPPVPANWAQIRNGIFAGESGGDYNALYGYQNRPGGAFENVRLTDMTVADAIAFSDPSGPYGQHVKRQIGRVATPMGAYQVVGTTLRAAVNGLGLSGKEKMTPEIQDMIGQWIYANQGTGAWEGYRGPQEQAPTGGGTVATRSTANAPTVPGLLAQEPRKPSIWDKLGPLADPDRRARLAMALEGMTLNPNQGVIAAAAGGIQDRKEDKRINQTVAWLQSMGRDDLAAAVMSGALQGSDAAGIALTPAQAPNLQTFNGPDGTVYQFNPATGETQPLTGAGAPEQPNLQTFRAADGTTYQFNPATGEAKPLTGPEAVPVERIVTGAEAQKLGLDPTMSYNVTETPGGVKATRIGGDGTTINVGSGKAETAFDVEAAKGQATMFTTMMQEGINANAELGQIDIIDGLLAQGVGGTADVWKTWAQDTLGVNVGAGGNVEALNAAINKLVPSQRPPGSGTMSDRDVQLFKSSLPQLVNSPQGNKIIVETMRGMSQYKRAQGEIAQAVMLGEANGGISRAEGMRRLAALPDPLAAAKAFIGASPGGSTAPTGGGMTPEEAARILLGGE